MRELNLEELISVAGGATSSSSAPTISNNGNIFGNVNQNFSQNSVACGAFPLQVTQGVNGVNSPSISTGTTVNFSV